MLNLCLLPVSLLCLVNSVVPQHSQCAGCISDLKESDCAKGETLQYDPNVLFGCCTLCRPGTPVPNKCRPPASCLADGSYAPVQCKGDLFTGRCFCSDPSGNRIFGQMWRSRAKKMSCACSRRRVELEATRKGVSLHCTPTGDYEPLQCDNGLCWCAQLTGQRTVPPVLQENMKLLPCYNAALMGESYLRRCESVVQALAEIHKEQSDHGTKYLSKPLALCDYDGSYGAYKIQGTSAYCTGRDGAILGAWSVESSKIAGMNCNCARDTAPPSTSRPPGWRWQKHVTATGITSTSRTSAETVPYTVPRSCELNTVPVPQASDSLSRTFFSGVRALFTEMGHNFKLQVSLVSLRRVTLVDRFVRGQGMCRFFFTVDCT